MSTKYLGPFSDLEMARRLEKTEARSNAAFVEARARTFPASGARWIEVAGAYVMYDGPTSPCTQTFGLGMWQPLTDSELDRIEDFYRELDAPIFHEVSPLADFSVCELLSRRGYRPIEFTSVMLRALDTVEAAPANERLVVRVVGEDEHESWARVSAQGWSEFAEFTDLMYDLALITAKRDGSHSFVAELDGQAIATGGLSIVDDVALLTGASTIPESRRQGAQLALLDSRLRFAREEGCRLAMMCALPGSASQRNAERQGFRIAYTRIKWGNCT